MFLYLTLCFISHHCAHYCCEQYFTYKLCSIMVRVKYSTDWHYTSTVWYLLMFLLHIIPESFFFVIHLWFLFYWSKKYIWISVKLLYIISIAKNRIELQTSSNNFKAPHSQLRWVTELPVVNHCNSQMKTLRNLDSFSLFTESQKLLNFDSIVTSSLQWWRK